MCALLVSVITLSGAANRSFRTEMEQWNPIGITQARSDSQITYRLTAGSAILPTVATAAPSGVLRDGSDNVITFTTAKAVGEKITFYMEYSGDKPTLSGATGTPKSGGYATYTLTSQTVTIRGDVTHLNCSDNQLTALDVSKNTELTVLYCSENQLTTLDVSKNTALILLNCCKNQLTALDVSKNTALKTLNCYNNQLKALDVSKNTVLRGLYCEENQLTTLDVSKNTVLIELYCYGNQIKGEKMTRLVNSLPDRTGHEAGDFTVVQEPDLEGNICLKSDVAIAKGKNWNTQEYDSDYNEYFAYEGAKLIISFTTKKAVGEKISLYMAYSGDAPTLSGATGTPESEKYVTYTLTSQTVTITGDVIYFLCSKDQLTALDVSRNAALTWLDCGSNQLTTLDVSKNTALIILECYNNQLTALDVSKNTALTELDCHNNQLTALDASKNIALTKLDCDNNQLTALDVSKNTTALTRIYCSGNQIKGEEMTRLVNSLPDRTGKKAGKFTVVHEPDLEGNICLKSDVAIAKGKNWNTRKYKSDTEEFVPYEGADVTYRVTLTKEGKGVLDVTGADNLSSVLNGTELTIVATPADGYELTALTANSTDILATKKFTVAADTEVKATFTKKTAAEVVAAGTLRLYPNPASTYVNVKGAKANALVRLYDANGALRYEARTDADGTLQIDLSAYPEGAYLLRVGNDAQRLLIQR